MRQADKIIISRAIFKGCEKQAEPGMIAIGGDRILYCGSAECLGQWKGVNTQVIDVGEKLVSSALGKNSKNRRQMPPVLLAV